MKADITFYGSATQITGLPCNPSTPHHMRVETMLYPSRNAEDAAVCLTVASDSEYSQGHAVLLTKHEVAALIGVLATHLAEMTD